MISVNVKQRGNPVLKFIRNVPWEYSEQIVPDYLLGASTCCLFLSLRYHNLHPEYIQGRVRELGRAYALRVLLVQADIKDNQRPLQDLAKLCLAQGLTLIVAWTPQDAGRYLEAYKMYEFKPADQLQERVAKDYISQLTGALTTVKSVSKTDVITLLSTFGSLRSIANASREDLLLCPGFGEQKVDRIRGVLDEPFVRPGRRAHPRFKPLASLAGAGSKGGGEEDGGGAVGESAKGKGKAGIKEREEERETVAVEDEEDVANYPVMAREEYSLVDEDD